MHYKTELRLIYRRFVRTLEDTDLAFEDVRREIQDLEPIRASFSNTEDECWPVRPEKTQEFQDKGYLLYLSGNPSIAVREMTISVVADSYTDAETRLARILSRFPNKFAAITISREYVTEVFAE